MLLKDRREQEDEGEENEEDDEEERTESRFRHEITAQTSIAVVSVLRRCTIFGHQRIKIEKRKK